MTDFFPHPSTLPQPLQGCPQPVPVHTPMRVYCNFQTSPPSTCRGTTYIDYERHNKHHQDELQLRVWDVTQEDLLKLQRRKHLEALCEQLCCKIFDENWLSSYMSSQSPAACASTQLLKDDTAAKHMILYRSKYWESFSVTIHDNNWWDFPWLPGAHLQDKDTSHKQQSWRGIQQHLWVWICAAAEALGCEHCGLLGLKESPGRDKCSQTAGDNSSDKLHTVPGTSEPGESGLQTGVTSDSRIRILHPSHLPANRYMAKSPTGYYFYFFKDKFLINTIKS